MLNSLKKPTLGQKSDVRTGSCNYESDPTDLPRTLQPFLNADRKTQPRTIVNSSWTPHQLSLSPRPVCHAVLIPVNTCNSHVFIDRKPVSGQIDTHSN